MLSSIFWTWVVLVLLLGFDEPLCLQGLNLTSFLCNKLNIHFRGSDEIKQFQMKKLNIIYLTLITIIFFSSCSSSDDNNETPTNSIIAKWEEQPVNTNCSQTETIEFFSNGTVQSLDLINAPCDYQLGTAEYTFEANVIEVNIVDTSFNDGIYTIKYNVITLNSTTLVVEPFYDDEVGTYTGSLERFTYLKI